MDVHHSAIEVAEIVRRSCAVAPVVAIVSETGRRRAVAATSCDLAEQILRDGRSVAVVDCDFITPLLHHVWQRGVSPGLSSVLVGASEIDDVFDYRALPTGRFLTVTAGEDAARRAHLFSTPIAEQAIRRLVDFAEIVLVNVGPLSGVAARSVVSLCDAVVVVTGAGIAMQPGYRPAQLHDLRVPIMAWTPDYLSTQDELVDPPAPIAAEPTSDLVPSWIDADHADVATNGHNGSAPPVVAAAAPEPAEEALAPAVAHVVHPPEAPADAFEAPVVAFPTPELAAVAAEAPVGVPAVGAMSAEAAELAPAEPGDVIVAEQPVPEPTAVVGLATESAPSIAPAEPEPHSGELEGLRLAGLWEKDPRGAPAPPVVDRSTTKKSRKIRRRRSRYLP